MQHNLFKLIVNACSLKGFRLARARAISGSEDVLLTLIELKSVHQITRIESKDSPIHLTESTER